MLVLFAVAFVLYVYDLYAFWVLFSNLYNVYYSYNCLRAVSDVSRCVSWNFPVKALIHLTFFLCLARSFESFWFSFILFLYCYMNYSTIFFCSAVLGHVILWFALWLIFCWFVFFGSYLYHKTSLENITELQNNFAVIFV